MRILTSTSARARFGQLLDMAQSEPVLIQRRGRDVAAVISPEEFRRLTKAVVSEVSPAVEKLHAESAKRWSKVYEALAG